MENSHISWTDHTFNPWLGCDKVSTGCKNCYAETLLMKRFQHLDVWGSEKPRKVTSDSYWRKPYSWNRKGSYGTRQRQRVFCGSLCDVFELRESLHEPRQRLWQLVRDTPNLDWQLLTKRPENFTELLPQDFYDAPYPNVWLGVSIENMDVAARADILRETPAHIRFISYEPALGPLNTIDLKGIHWVIYGGESGPNHREDDPQWGTDMYEKCKTFDVAFWYKQDAHQKANQIVYDTIVTNIRQWPLRA